jgi:hypothetical protein
MNQRNELHKYRNCIPLAALVAVLTCGMDVPAFADSRWLLENMVIHTPSSRDASRGERMLALEKARIAFEYATVAKGDKEAQYEYYLAEGYLNLAAKEMREGDKIGVIQFAAESEKYSRVVAKTARGGSE